jgi:hypothetical protein
MVRDVVRFLVPRLRPRTGVRDAALVERLVDRLVEELEEPEPVLSPNGGQRGEAVLCTSGTQREPAP